jgi:hypothetical protein
MSDGVFRPVKKAKQSIGAHPIEAPILYLHNSFLSPKLAYREGRRSLQIALSK